MTIQELERRRAQAAAKIEADRLKLKREREERDAHWIGEALKELPPDLGLTVVLSWINKQMAIADNIEENNLEGKNTFGIKSLNPKRIPNLPRQALHKIREVISKPRPRNTAKQMRKLNK